MNPPHCTVHFCAQRSPEWFQLRRGMLTASEFGPWLIEKPEVRISIKDIQAELDRLGIAYPKAGKKEDYVALLPDVTPFLSYTQTTQKAREAAICKVIAGIGNLWEPPSFENAAMQRGTELEPDAVAAFEAWSGRKVTQVGFCSSIHGRFGCSPDGLINDHHGLHGFETKVPIPATHIGYRRAGVLPDEYLYQVHGSLCVTGLSVWHFQSFNPGLASLRVTVERNDFTEELLAALKSFSADVDSALAAEAEAWEAEFQPSLAADYTR